MFRLYRSSGDPSPITLGDRARDAGQWEAAARHYRTALLRNPERPPIWVQYGHALKASGKLMPAEAAYRRAIDEDPSDGDAHLQLGHVLKLQGRIDEAKAAYSFALALDRSLEDAAAELAALGARVESVSDRAEGLPKTDGKPAGAHRRRRKASVITRADRARDLGEWESAARLYRQALGRNPRNAPIWVQYGHMQKESGQLREAEMAYRRALLVGLDPADLYLDLGHVLKAQGRTEEAGVAYLRAFASNLSRRHSLVELSALGWSPAEIDELLAACSLNDMREAADLALDSNVGLFAQRSGSAKSLSVCMTPVADECLSEADAGLKQELASLSIEEQAERIRQSGLFDGEWYLLRYPDVKRAGMDPALHYVEVGAAEGRNPNPTFETEPYIRAFPELTQSGINPLLHYLANGCRGPINVPDLFHLRGVEPRGSIAVVLHLFDASLWEEMRAAIANIPYPFDLFVSVTKGHSDHMRNEILAAFTHAYVFDFEDHGRDIGAFLVFLQSGVLFKYDLICKLHTKRSSHLANGDAWRQALIAGVLGNPTLVERIVESFRADPDIGIVVADGQIYRGADRWVGCINWLNKLLPRIGISSDVEDRSFPGGSIFWIRPFLLRTLLGLGLEFADFEREPLSVDGGLGHAIERIFGLICEAGGMRVVEQSRLAISPPGSPSASSKVHLIAFYLPQFHPIPENDAWWGKGFTEWSNVARAKALFDGHRQPRLPADLGYYDLRLPETREAQAELARKYGLSAFCYYYYWFNGRRILERPLDEVSRTGSPNFPFLICWANEPWSRNWDGLAQDILLPQTYEPGWERQFAQDVAPLMRDPRYFRFRNKPMLLIYRVGHIPDWKTSAGRLRNALTEEGILEVHLAAAWVRFPEDGELPSHSKTLGLDSYFEFPPHRSARRLPQPSPPDVPEELGGLYDYNYTAASAIADLKSTPVEGRHRGVMAGWDNTPRRLERAHVFHGATPANFRRWLRATIGHERERGDEAVVFINAWNEWAEGAYLEPDQQFGHGWLEAVASAMGPNFAKDVSPLQRRIQVHRRGALGDVLLVSPILKALRKKYPNDEIVVTSDYPEIIAGNPFVDDVMKSSSMLPGFDHVFDLQYENLPDEHIVDAYARAAGLTISDRTPEIYLGQDERAACVQFLESCGLDLEKKFCVMQITSGWHLRDWPTDRFRDVARALEWDDISSVILGQSPDPAIDFGIDLRGRTSIREAAAIIEKCTLLVTIDSSLMHMGYAFRRPTISLFGCTDPEKRVPDWARSTALYSDVECRGCHHRQRPVPIVTAPSCPWETVRCMDRLASDRVIAVAKLELAKADKPLVSVVIPHYHRWEMLHECISSILRCSAQCCFEVVVVADGSPQQSLAELEGWRPNVRVVTLHPNQGFSKACNAGAKAARGVYILFLNDDTTVTPGWLDELVSFMAADPRIGITGPQLLYPDNDTIQHCGTVFNEHGLGEHIYRHSPKNFGPAERPRYYRALTGACLLIERAFFYSLHQFDTEFHGAGGCEDTDLCFKVLAAGRMVAYCPSSVVYHHEGVTRGLRGPDHPEDMHNRALLAKRWSQYLVPDISDYLHLAEIEAREGKTWRWLRDVPPEIVARYAASSLRVLSRSADAAALGNQHT
jgi:lipopolysaccharide biosynthesis protein/GT2 family glycosyltransferase/ADP-heptose:LPS heptosyltransferase/tetratricopeptide (TPR) repeat protein